MKQQVQLHERQHQKLGPENIAKQRLKLTEWDMAFSVSVQHLTQLRTATVWTDRTAMGQNQTLTRQLTNLSLEEGKVLIQWSIYR